MVEEKQEFQGIVDSLIPRYKKITIILTGITDEDFAKLLSAGRIKIIIVDDLPKPAPTATASK